MENKEFTAKIIIMLKLRRLLVVLQKLNEQDIYPDLNKFMLYLAGFDSDNYHYPLSARWFYLNHTFEIRADYKKFKQKIITLIKDNLGNNPDKHFIDYHEDYGYEKRGGLAVTARGRKLIRKLGFIQIIGSEFSIIWALIGWAVSIIIAIITTYLTSIN